MDLETFARLMEERNIPSKPGYYWCYSTYSNYKDERIIPFGIVKVSGFVPYLIVELVAILGDTHVNLPAIVGPADFYYHSQEISFPKGAANENLQN